MTEEEIARCFQIEDFRDHPELHVGDNQGRNFVCDKRHAALWYCQGWNHKVINRGGYAPPTGLHNHPAAIRAWQMGWDDADLESETLPLPNILEGIEVTMVPGL